MASVLEELEGLFPAAASETVYDIRLDLISPDPDQPRKGFRFRRARRPRPVH